MRQPVTIGKPYGPFREEHPRCERPSESAKGTDIRAANIEKVAAEIPEEAFSILVSHTPEVYDRAADANFDLITGTSLLPVRPQR
jgi:predicted MPP superfamily phosphohydrolase